MFFDNYYLIICAICVFCFGYKYDTLYILLYVSSLDFLLGSVKALMSREFELKFIRIGIFKKISQVFVCSLGYQINKIGIATEINFFAITCYGYIIYEICSLLTNLKNMGVFIPQKFLDKITQINK